MSINHELYRIQRGYKMIKTMKQKLSNIHSLRIAFVYLCLGIAILFGSVTTVYAKSLEDQIKDEFKAYKMPSQFQSIGTAFTHYDSLDTPGKLWSDSDGSRPCFYSAKGLCDGKYDEYTYTNTPQYVYSLIQQLGLETAGTDSFKSKFITDGEMFVFVEGQYPVVDFDEKTQRYIVWIQGYFNWEMVTAHRSCALQGWNMSIRSGFYAIDKRYVYIDDITTDQKIPKSIGTGNIMKPYLLLYKEPSLDSDIYWWANAKVNTPINIVGEEGDFYAVSFQAKQFLKKNRVCYVQKKYVDATLKGITQPDYNYTAQTTNKLNIREEANTSSRILGVADKGTQIRVIAKGEEFDSIIFNGKTAYMMNAYLDNYNVQDDKKCNITLTGDVTIKKITTSKITFTWKKSNKADAYAVEFCNTRHKEQKVQKTTTNSITVPIEVVNDSSAVFMKVRVYALKSLGDGHYSVSNSYIQSEFTIAHANSFSVKRSGSKMQFSYYLPEKCGTQIQYADNKDFSNAKSFNMKFVTGKRGEETKTITGLSSSKKYYVRARGYFEYKVGEKTYKHYGDWSEIETY